MNAKAAVLLGMGPCGVCVALLSVYAVFNASLASNVFRVCHPLGCHTT